MLSTAKRATLSVVLLLIMPIIVWISGWIWRPNGNSPQLESLYWITETSSFPWAVITSLLFSIWFVWLLNLSTKSAIRLIFILAIAIIAGQGVKSLIKESIEEPRPFVAWLESEYQIDDEAFYQLLRKERAQLVKQQLINENRVPSWLGSHWQNETGYAFPSGHALFSATWAIFAMLLLWPRKHYLSTAIIIVWAVIVAGSRLMLGMHWPQDLMLSIILAGFIAFITCRYIDCQQIIGVKDPARS